MFRNRLHLLLPTTAWIAGVSAMPTCTTDAVPPAIATGAITRSGAEGVELRPLCPDDSAAVLAVFAGMGTHSRELRFLASKTRLTEADVRHLTGVDGRNHVGVLAVARPDRPIGIARLIRDHVDHDLAEVAVEVVDEWQDRGVGTELLLELRERAVDAGVRRFKVFVSPDNSAVHRLLARMPGAVTMLSTDRWTTEYLVWLDRWAPISFRASAGTCRIVASG